MEYITADITAKGRREFFEAPVNKTTMQTVDMRKVEFRSTSMFHDHGRLFTLDEALTKYGPVGIQITDDRGNTRMIEYDGVSAAVL